MIDYVEGLGPFWTKLVEQMVPATTIWNGGVKLENSILHRQKFVYRRQRGCELIAVPKEPCEINSAIYPGLTSSQFITTSIYPWLNGNPTVSNFSSVLLSSLSNVLAQQNLTINQCAADTLISNWYVNLKIGNTTLVNQLFFTGYGTQGYPSNLQWRQALLQYLPLMNPYGYSFTINGNTLTIFNSTSTPNFNNQTLNLSVSIQLSINCG